MPTTTRRLLLGLLVAGFLFRLGFVTHDMRELVTHGPLYDDSFYCFQIARNIAQGYGSTFDRVHPTNGYQPLYVLLLVPLYALAGGHANAPIYVALVLSALINTLTGWLLFRIVRRYTSTLAAFFALVLWSFGPAIVRQAVNGLETSLAMFLLAATFEYYVLVFRPHPRPGTRQAATLGALLGLATLARIDAVLFAVALAFDALWHRRSGSARPLALAACVAAGLLLPWCVASVRISGTPLPESGPATRLLSEAYAPHDYPGLAPGSNDGSAPPLFLLGNLVHSLLQLGTSPVLHLYTRGLERLTAPIHIASPTELYVTTALLALAAIGLGIALRRTRFNGGWKRGEFDFVFVYCGLLLAAYSFVIFGQIFYSRYYYPIFFVSIALGAVAFEVLMKTLPQRWRGSVAGLVLAAYGLALPYMCLHRMQNGNYRFLHVVDWIQVHTPKDATIGIFNSGAIAYFSDRHIVNLDGKVNPAALKALRQGKIRDYVATAGLDYVIDHEWILGHFLLQDAAGEPALRFARVEGDDTLGVPGWGAFHVEHVAANGELGASVASRRGE